MNAIVSYALVGLALLISASLLVSMAITGTPSLPSGTRAAQDVISLLREAKMKDDAVIYDLGSGFGSLVMALAGAFPRAQVRGVEISPFPYLVSRLRALRHANVQIAWGDFTRCDLSDADAVTCYLMPATMPRVAGLLDARLRSSVLVVSIDFWFRRRQVTATRRRPMNRAVAIYVWPAKLQEAGESALPEHVEPTGSGERESPLICPIATYLLYPVRTRYRHFFHVSRARSQRSGGKYRAQVIQGYIPTSLGDLADVTGNPSDFPIGSTEYPAST